jgi:hypothetical protein
VSATNLNIPANATSSQVGAALGPIFQNFSLLMPSIVLVGLIGDLLLIMGLRDLTKVDNSKFSLPWKLLVVLIIGAVLAAAGLIPLFNDMPNIIAQAPTGTGTPSAAFSSAISSLVSAALVATNRGDPGNYRDHWWPDPRTLESGFPIQLNNHQGWSHIRDHTSPGLCSPDTHPGGGLPGQRASFQTNVRRDSGQPELRSERRFLGSAIGHDSESVTRLSRSELRRLCLVMKERQDTNIIRLNLGRVTIILRARLFLVDMTPPARCLVRRWSLRLDNMCGSE